MMGQAKLSFVLTRRRPIAPPTMPKPTIIIAHVEGSGTAPIPALELVLSKQLHTTRLGRDTNPFACLSERKRVLSLNQGERIRSTDSFTGLCSTAEE
jgi:hypothetical protein